MARAVQRPPGMRLFTALAGLSLLLTAACGTDIDEPAGAASYFIENRASEALYVDFESLGAEPAAGATLPMRLEPGQTTLFATDGIIGVNPKPTDSFTALTLHSGTSTAALAPRYAQDPIDDATWTGGRTDSEDYGASEWTLTIADADLTN